MNGYITYTEVQSMITTRLLTEKREQIKLNPVRRPKLRELAVALMSFLF